MALPPPFEAEDTDEDFFDKLVEDDDDDEILRTLSVPSVGVDNYANQLKAFSDLSISEVPPTEVDYGGKTSFGIDGENGLEDEVIMPAFDAHCNKLVDSESIAATVDNVVQSSDVPIGDLNTAAGVKEVDWSAFNSDSHLHRGSGFGSYSDFFSEAEDNSEDPFSKVNDTGKFAAELKGTDNVSVIPVTQLSSVQHQDGQLYETGTVQSVDGQDLNSTQYWENAYPGWRYDPNTGQWHQLDGYTADAFTNVTTQEKSDVNALQATDMAPEQKSELYYSQQTTQSNVGSNAEAGTTGTVSNWNQVSQENAEYPAHMVFDAQYPGWYYDMNVQEWKSLESYTTSIKQSTNVDYNQKNPDVNGLTGGNFSSNIIGNHGISEQAGNYQSNGISGQGQVSWTESINNYQHTPWQPGQVPNSEASISLDNQFGNVNDSKGQEYNSTYHQSGFKPLGENVIHGQTSQGFNETNGVVGFQSFIPAGNFVHQINHSKIEPTQQMNGSPAYFQGKNSASFSQQAPHNFTQFSHPSNEGRSPAGRPPHALVTFGFGGKLVVMRDNSSSYEISAFNNQDSAGGVVNVFNLAEVVKDKIGASSIGLGVCDYFQSLYQRSFPGPLAGGSVGSKELNKWIDEKIANGEYGDRDYSKGEILKKLFCLLKIACQHYGNLRSPFSNDQALKDTETPESAVAKLFASDSEKSALVREYRNHTSCLHKLPQEAHSHATALNVQQLLVSGRKKEALECAQQGQLWGPALVLAHQLGDQFYGDTLKQMALQQFVAGSPLRTLCLLIAGQPADVFANSTTHSNFSNAYNIPQQPVQIGSNNILDQWEENLAIITANRTKDDERVITHLGDCLWKERGEVTAAHMCYLVAEVNIESHSDSARLCLIGADHWKCPRTYASPEAIQRTELYEYSKVLGNPQSVLLPFQPYKLIYAHMLAEVGKLSDSLKYCQAIFKSLKTGRTPETDTWKQLLSSLEERIRTHQQGGFGTNLAPTKIVGKLFSFFDKTSHHVAGGLPPTVPMSSHVQPHYIEHAGHQQGVPRVANSQSTRAMSTLMPSASMEPINEWTGGNDRMAIPNRSVSEPDFGKTPAKVDSSKEANTVKTSGSGGSSRFGRFGSQIFQKTVGLVIRSRPDKQAKLGDKNKFYYDENLKRWVEEGVEPPAVAAAPPPPPTVAVFQNGLPDENGIIFSNEMIDTSSGPEIKNQITSERSPGIPPMPPSSNQFSARGRMGVRARYVDTFNKGGGSPVNLFQSPSIAKSGGTFNPSFFVPPSAVSSEETLQTTGENVQDTVVMNGNLSSADKVESNSSPPTSTTSTSSSVSMQRFPSMDSIRQRRMSNDNNALNPQSRRAASWSGGLCDENNKPLNKSEIKPLSGVSGLRPSPFMPSNPPSMRVEDLHEVQL